MRVDSQAVRSQPAPATKLAAEVSGPMTVLLVEDDVDLRDAMTTLFHLQGWSVLPAADGLTAIQQVNRHYDAVVLDMLLPGASGFQVIQAVRNRRGPQLPVIMVSGNGLQAHQDYAAILGISCFLEKPVSMDNLLKVLRESIANK